MIIDVLASLLGALMLLTVAGTFIYRYGNVLKRIPDIRYMRDLGAATAVVQHTTIAMRQVLLLIYFPCFCILVITY